MAKIKRAARVTKLIVCEGPSDKAFLEYLRQCYCNGGHGAMGPKLTFKFSGGKGADHVISKLIASAKNAAYDKLIAMHDADIDPSRQSLEDLNNAQGTLITISPFCLEGMLLDVLGKPIGSSSQDCKSRFSALLPDAMDASNYKKLFNKQLLDTRVAHSPSLASLLQQFQAEDD